MGSFDYIDPSKVRCTPGKVLVQIVEVLGGTTASGLWKPPQDHGGKDTFYGKILQVGPPPTLKHVKTDERSSGWDVAENSSGNKWPDQIMNEFKVGDIGVFPRDVPLVFVHDDKRYGICLIHEAILVLDAEQLKNDGFEFVAWQPGEAI
jgi:hypothetical protein